MPVHRLPSETRFLEPDRPTLKPKLLTMLRNSSPVALTTAFQLQLRLTLPKSPPRGTPSLRPTSSSLSPSIATANCSGRFRTSARSIAFRFLPNGHVLTQRNWTLLVELDADRKVVLGVRRPELQRQRGEGARSPRLPAAREWPDDVAENGVGRIIKVDAAGKLVHEMNTDVSSRAPTAIPGMVRKLPSGNYLVCHERKAAWTRVRSAWRHVWEYEVRFGKPLAGGHGPRRSATSSSAPSGWRTATRSSPPAKPQRARSHAGEGDRLEAGAERFAGHHAGLGDEWRCCPTATHVGNCHAGRTTRN